MPLIVVARFDTLAAAASAAHALMGEGFRDDAVAVFRAADQRERWPRARVHAAMARIAGLAAAGSGVAAAAAALLDTPAPYGVAIAACGALAGSLIATLISRAGAHRARPYRAQGAFVAVVAEPARAAQSAQLLHDAGGWGVERLGGRYVSPEALYRDAGFDEFHAGQTIP
ncbi:hypothetical protein [Bordetella genomosp. 9]|uniref:Uncharacterized protein n=1 Tax=Bordetella genomosp. 9 TaxID=1416803 RepID=A0A1W6YYM5_9BORD|nr:hypothetical protein [Bordetella genomosp. 9]ARP86178.1 hypothetical protein CAL13_08155 [Bordetella genomosp. 9]ARP90197.1 hypothetical protein CAL14_07765 [Bordetella genomosp. 9]